MTPTTPTTPTTRAKLTAVARYTGTWRTSHGYTAALTVAFGRVSPPATAERVPGDVSALDQCREGRGTAVIPFQLTLTNTTRGWSLENLTINPAGFSPVEWVNSSGAHECATRRAASNPPKWASIAPGQDVVVKGYVVLNTYYTPRQPSGPPGGVATATFEPQVYDNPASGPADGWPVVWLRGPHISGADDRNSIRNLGP
jgi:hypothetical protein